MAAAADGLYDAQIMAMRAIDRMDRWKLDEVVDYIKNRKVTVAKRLMVCPETETVPEGWQRRTIAVRVTVKSKAPPHQEIPSRRIYYATIFDSFIDRAMLPHPSTLPLKRPIDDKKWIMSCRESNTWWNKSTVEIEVAFKPIDTSMHHGMAISLNRHNVPSGFRAFARDFDQVHVYTTDDYHQMEKLPSIDELKNAKWDHGEATIHNGKWFRTINSDHYFESEMNPSNCIAV
jgi:hypothetical protein